VIDVQATYACTALVKAIADVHKKMEPDVHSTAAVAMEVFVNSIPARGETLNKAFVRQVIN
jgi:hypothetical protein